MTVSPPIIALDEVDSTSSDIRRRLERGDAPPFWVSARRQSAGRGRRGRAWASVEGNLFASGVYRLSCPALEAAQLSFAACLAVADVADAWVEPARVSLKWPNDIFIRGRKAAGVLLESHEAARGLDLIIGVGVNLAAAPSGVGQPVTCFVDELRAGVHATPAASDAAVQLVDAFERWRTVWASDGFGPIRAAWLARAHGLGEEVTARIAGREISGVFYGLDESGALIVQTPDGQALVHAGEVVFTSNEAA